MNLEQLKNRYNSESELAERNFLCGFAHFLGEHVHSIEFAGGEHFNDEDYEDVIFDILINFESVRTNLESVCWFYEKIFGHKKEIKFSEYPKADICDIWYEIKEKLEETLPAFVKQKTTSWTRLPI
jgi:hypothetical protein